MSGSVEQAALARAERDALPDPWPEVLDAMEDIARASTEGFKMVNLIRERHAKEIDRHDDELAEIRESLLALSNRIEAVTRGMA